MTIEMIVPGIAIDTLDIVDIGAFRDFVRGALGLLNEDTVGKEFLTEFRPEIAGVTGGQLFPQASLVIVPPTVTKVSKMQSVAETTSLTYEIPGAARSPFLDEMVNQPAIKKLSVADLASRAHLVPGPKAQDFQTKLGKLKSATLYFQVPANTNAGSVADLLKAGKLFSPYPDGTTPVVPTTANAIAFKAAVNCFEVPGGGATIVRHSDLAVPLGQGRTKYPAKITIFTPGAKLPSDFSNPKLSDVQIGHDGNFMYYGSLENLKVALVHEMMHAYYYLQGTPEISDPEDEKRAVGLFEYKDNKYSENRFRGVMNLPPRTNYIRLGVADDPELIKNPFYFMLWIPGIGTLPYDRNLKGRVDFQGEVPFRAAFDRAVRQAGKQDELRAIIFGSRVSWGDEMTKWVVSEVSKLKGEGYRIGVSKSFFEHGTKHVRLYLRYEKS
jgi:hypothetical protein